MIGVRDPPEALKRRLEGNNYRKDQLSFAFKLWGLKGRPYFLHHSPASQVFKSVDTVLTPEQAEPKATGTLLAVLPGWLRGFGYREPTWQMVIKTSGFIVVRDESQHPTAFSGRRLSPSEIDFNLIQSWIEYCDGHHGNLCRSTSSIDLPGFKVIDCKTQKIVKPRRQKPYIALSYVWGETTPSAEPPAPGELPASCPAVIENAMSAVLKLNHRYLWVDRYCINQANVEEKHEQIANMDLIYASACLTIIAASSDGSIDGLPGIGQTQRVPQPAAQKDEHTFLSSLPDPAYLINQSKWMSRGWTYQEGLLSRRRLIFTEYQVYFQCSAMHCFESINFPLDGWHVIGKAESVKAKSGQSERYPQYLTTSRVFPIQGIAETSSDFASRVNEYGQRSLSFDADGLNAFLGVLKVFENADPPVFHYWGIPIFEAIRPFEHRKHNLLDCFALGLAWETKVPGISRHQLPSWSWVGWKDWGGFSIPARMRRRAPGRTYEVTLYNEHANLEIGIESSDGSTISYLKESGLDHSLLSSRSPNLHLGAYTTLLRLRKTAGDGNHAKNWEFLDQPRSRPETVCIRFPNEVGREHRWKAVLLGFQHGPVGFQSGDVRLTFLLVEPAGTGYYERVGVCSFVFQGAFKEQVDGTAAAGEMVLQREKIVLR